MSHLRLLQRIFSRWPRASVALGFLAVLLSLEGALARADRLPPDPVDELAQALKQGAKESGRSKAAEDYRRANLDKKIAALRTPGDMSRALLLSDWQDASVGLDRTLAIIDQQARQKLADRFKESIRRSLSSESSTIRAAAAGLVGETAALGRERGVQPAVLQAMLAELAVDLARSTKDNDPRVRTQATLALGKVEADPKRTVPPLENMLTSDNAALHRPAAEALNNLVRILPQAAKKPRGATNFAGPAISNQAMVEMSATVVPAAARGLTDRDPEVRRLCAAAIHEAAQLLTDMIAEPVGSEYPPAERPLTEDERKAIDFDRENILRERKELTPLTNALRDQAGALSVAVSDPSPAVRVLVLHALEQMGSARLRLLRRAASVPDVGPVNGGDKKEPEKKKEGEQGAQLNADDPIHFAAGELAEALPTYRLPEGQDPLLEGLKKTLRAQAKALADERAEVRLAAVDSLEMLGDDAAPVAPHLAWAMTDPDLFVRWAAARALGKMSPAKAGVDTVVPKLAEMLSDPDLDLRLIAAQSLERYGPAARAAVPALARATGIGDMEIRRAAIRALVGIGTDSASAIPDIGNALSNQDVRVRRAAAEALARFGPLARPAEGALQKAMNDSDPEVRRFAQDALLRIR